MTTAMTVEILVLKKKKNSLGGLADMWVTAAIPLADDRCIQIIMK